MAFDSVKKTNMEEEKLSALCFKLERQQTELQEMLAGEMAKRYEACLKLQRRILLQTDVYKRQPLMSFIWKSRGTIPPC